MRLVVQITGIFLNQSYYICPSCATPHLLFGSPDHFRSTASRLGVEVLGELPLVSGVSRGGDGGLPYALIDEDSLRKDGLGGTKWNEVVTNASARVWKLLS